MSGDFVDASTHRPDDFTRRTVRILIAGQKKCQVCMPQIALEPMARRKLQQGIHALEKQAPQIFSVIIIIMKILHKKGHILQDISIFHILIQY